MYVPTFIIIISFAKVRTHSNETHGGGEREKGGSKREGGRKRERKKGWRDEVSFLCAKESSESL